MSLNLPIPTQKYQEKFEELKYIKKFNKKNQGLTKDKSQSILVDIHKYICDINKYMFDLNQYMFDINQ